MPRRSNQTQKLIHLIERQLSGAACVRQSVELPDRSSGEKREVDIVIDLESGRHISRIGIEVITGRGYTPWVESMIGKHQMGHLTDKLILVAGNGFSAPACAKAAAHGVTTLTLEDAAVVDWEATVFSEGKLWFARLDLSPREIALTVEKSFGFDAPIELGPGTAVFFADSSTKTTLLQLVHRFVRDKTPLRDVYTRKDRMKLRSFRIRGALDQEVFVLDEAGQSRRVNILDVKGDVRFAMIDVDMQRASYDGRAVAYAEGEINGDKLLVVGVQQRGAEPTWSLNLAKKENDPGIVVDLTLY